MDGECSRNAISERCSSTRSIEFIHGPCHPDVGKNSVLRFDGHCAVWSQNKLKVVLDTDEAVFATSLRTSELTVSALFFVPGRVGNLFVVYPNRVGASIPVGYFDLNLSVW